MSPKLPERPESHQLADESERFFRNCLPREWICDAPAHDYGVDFHISLVSDGHVTGRILLVQLKSSNAEAEGKSVSLRLNVSTVNYLKDMLGVVLLVKYVASEKEAYWQLLKNVPPPPEDQETITVRIPRANKLSQNPWTDIARHIENVQERKLGATRT